MSSTLAKKSFRVVPKIATQQFAKKTAAILAAVTFVGNSAQALTFDELQGLTYLQVKGSGLANTCPVIDGGSSNLRDLPAGDYTFDKFCIEPTSFKVKQSLNTKVVNQSFWIQNS